MKNTGLLLLQFECLSFTKTKVVVVERKKEPRASSGSQPPLSPHSLSLSALSLLSLSKFGFLHPDDDDDDDEDFERVRFPII